VLFYLKEDTPAPQDSVNQCLEIFDRFHTQLMVIEHDTVCQCGACQTASNLTLKFIAQHVEIKEIKVAQFVKATGVDMIIAHRLLKNNIDSNEYILITRSCLDGSGASLPSDDLSWQTGAQTYTAIGEVAFQFADLKTARRAIPNPPALKEYVIVKGEDHLEVPINASLHDVYQWLINVDERKDWILPFRDSFTRTGSMGRFAGLTRTSTFRDPL
jgi:hypothetical protein